MSKSPIIKYGLTVLSALILAACSGGGSSVNVDTQGKKEPVLNTDSVSNSNDSTPEDKVTGKYVVVTGSYSSSEISEGDLTTTDFSSVTIEGKKIALAKPIVHSGNWKKSVVQEKITRYCCSNFTNVMLGSYDGDPERNGGYYNMFYYGHRTKDMPQTGTANYEGESLYATTAGDADTVNRGTSTFTVNFAEKTLIGEAKNSLATIGIQAQINGNKFFGEAKSTNDSASANVEGGFYGANAKELAGLAFAKDKEGSAQWGVGFIAGKK